jgi:hypothetical protein
MVTIGSFTVIPTIDTVQWSNGMNRNAWNFRWNAASVKQKELRVLVAIHEMEQLGGCLHADANSSVSPIWLFRDGQ